MWVYRCLCLYVCLFLSLSCPFPWHLCVRVWEWKKTHVSPSLSLFLSLSICLSRSTHSLTHTRSQSLSLTNKYLFTYVLVCRQPGVGGGEWANKFISWRPCACFSSWCTGLEFWCVDEKSISKVIVRMWIKNRKSYFKSQGLCCILHWPAWRHSRSAWVICVCVSVCVCLLWSSSELTFEDFGWIVFNYFLSGKVIMDQSGNQLFKVSSTQSQCIEDATLEAFPQI